MKDPQRIDGDDQDSLGPRGTKEDINKTDQATRLIREKRKWKQRKKPGNLSPETPFG